MLDPPVFWKVVRALSPTVVPSCDAFASPHTAQLSTFWTATDDALRQDWVGSGLLWANPPFSLLPRVLAKLRSEGGNCLLLVPEWAPALPALAALARDSFLLPPGPIFRARGGTLLPAPR